MYFNCDRWGEDKNKTVKEDKMKRKNQYLTGLLLLGALLLAVPTVDAAGVKEEYIKTGYGNKVKKQEEELTRLYEKGITNRKEQIEARKRKVKELHLEEFADQDFFLSKEYSGKFTIDELEQKGMTILVRCMTEDQIARWEQYVKAKIQPMRIERGKDLISWTNSAGITTRTYAFEVDGNVAFCGDHGKTAPTTGSSHSAYIPVTDEKIQKVLYYGYQGPEDQMTKAGYSKSKSYVIMAMMISNFRRGKAPGANGSIFWDQIKDLPAPPKDAGTAYYVETNEEHLQDLFFYKRAEKGKLKLQKKSTDPKITKMNENYSLQGAQYGVYEDPDAAGKEIAVLTTNEDGESQEIFLEQGTYFIREKKAAKGFRIDETIYPVEVQEEKETTFVCEEFPKMQKIRFILTKIDAETKENKPQGMAGLKDARFIVRYYKRLWDGNPATVGVKPDCTWIFKTDEKGQCKYEESYRVSGDPLFLDKDQIPALPYGTISIEEEKAPEGYLKNYGLYMKQIREDEEQSSLFLKNGISVPESVMKLQFLKRADDKKTVLEGAVFEYCRPDGQTEEIRTDQNGSFVLKGLLYGTHQLQEKTPPDGYEKNENVISFTINEENQVTFESTMDPKFGETDLKVDKDGNIFIEMEDKRMSYNLQILKSDGKGKVLQNAEFTLYEDQKCSRSIQKSVTNEKGQAFFYGLQLKKTYYLKETNAPDGYRADKKVQIIKAEEMPENKEMTLDITNEPMQKLPDTGSYSMLFIIFAGYMVCLWLFIRKNR